MAEQLPLLERPEHDMGAALLLPEDLPELRSWIDEAITSAEGSGGAWRRLSVAGGQSVPDYSMWPHAWVLRDLFAALPDADRFAKLVETRHAGASVDAREVRALIAAVAEEPSDG